MSSSEKFFDIWVCSECFSQDSSEPPVTYNGEIFCSETCFSTFADALESYGVSVRLRPGEEPDVVN